MSAAPAPVICPYCGESVETLVDSPQEGMRYIEDCPVCCRPIEFRVHLDAGKAVVTAARDDD